jgi:hypothetical protein
MKECCLCLKHTGNLENILEDHNQKYFDFIVIFTGIKVSKNFNIYALSLPCCTTLLIQQVCREEIFTADACSNCLNTLEKCLKFHKKVKKSFQNFINHLQPKDIDDAIKVEIKLEESEKTSEDNDEESFPVYKGETITISELEVSQPASQAPFISNEEAEDEETLDYKPEPKVLKIKKARRLKKEKNSPILDIATMHKNDPRRKLFREPLQCSYCLKVLPRPSVYETHLRTHTGER